MIALYKSKQGKKEILNLYNEKLKDLNIEYQYKTIDTTYGNTNIIVTGNPSNPPILIIHGSNACAPIAIETYHLLNSQYHVYAIDVLAQPNKSAETRLSMKDNSYGVWMYQIIKRLDIKDVTMAGFSFGGLVILKTLEYNETYIKEVFLSAPAYIINGNPLKALFKIFIPMKRFMKTQKKKHIDKFLAELFTTPDAFAFKYLSKVFIYFKMDFSPVPTITKQNAKAIKTPITLIAAKQDLIFPGEKMIKRAKYIFPSLKKHVLLEHSKHVQSTRDNILIQNIILNK